MNVHIAHKPYAKEEGQTSNPYNIEGAFKNTRASDTRCFSPPLNCKNVK